MKAEEFDRKFDKGESIVEHLDLSQIKRGNPDQQVIALQFPSKLVSALKQESQRLNLPLQVMLENWIEERLSAS
jgi:hypothetical protein